MKIIFIGSTGPLSLIPFQALVQSKHTVCAFAFDDDSEFNIINSGSIQSFALTHSIPLIKLNKSYSNTISQIQSYQADIILVSCYVRLLPQSILSAALKASINIHPSLLPGFRGPAPLFWQFREGIKDFGVTLHRMTTEFDTGNILSQKSVNMQDGINKNEATKLLAHVASELMLDTLDDIQNKSLTETAQDNLIASYQSYPGESDYRVSTLWTAKRIYNFINAYKGTGVSFTCKVNEDEFKLIDAYSYQEEAYDDMSGTTVVLEGDKITFSCQNGYIQCQIEID